MGLVNLEYQENVKYLVCKPNLPVELNAYYLQMDNNWTINKPKL